MTFSMGTVKVEYSFYYLNSYLFIFLHVQNFLIKSSNIPLIKLPSICFEENQECGL